MATIKLICPVCQNMYEKPNNEYNRNTKKGQLNFCSLSCAKKGKRHAGGKGDISYMGDKRCIGKSIDEWSPFRRYLNHVKKQQKRVNQQSRLKFQYSDLTLKALKDIWLAQSGVCPLTGWQMHLPNTTHDPTYNYSPRMATLDRIDSSKGYLIDNVQFVSYWANIMKSNYTQSAVIDYCKQVANWHKNSV
jgi:hypothetical protein